MGNNKLARNMRIVLIVSILIFIGGSIYIKNTQPERNEYVDLFPGYGKEGQMMQEYYPTGELRASGVRKKHKKHGKWVYLNIDGSLALEEWYEDGVLIESKEHNILASDSDSTNI